MNARNSLFSLVALGAALAAPLAFAQSDDAAAAQQTPPTTEAAPATPTDAAPKQVSWSDLDADKDGNLTRTEAASVQSLSDVFEQADADTDGTLTPDEYKNYIAKNSNGATTPGQDG